MTLLRLPLVFTVLIGFITLKVQHAFTQYSLLDLRSQRSNKFTSSSSSSCLEMAYYSRANRGRSSPNRGNIDRSKRQERVGHLVRTELAKIIHTGLIKGDCDYLDGELRQRISIINADVSPDLAQARITVSIRNPTDGSGTSSSMPVVDQRRAYAWLVHNTKYIRHTLVQHLSHMKKVPNLSFVQVDVASAVDVMYLIDKVSNGYKRENVGLYGGNDDSLPRGMVAEEDNDDDWEDEDFDNEMIRSIQKNTKNKTKRQQKESDYHDDDDDYDDFDDDDDYEDFDLDDL